MTPKSYSELESEIASLNSIISTIESFIDHPEWAGEWNDKAIAIARKITDIKIERDNLRAQLAQSHTVVDSYAAEMREESLERDAINYLADDDVVRYNYDTQSYLCEICKKGGWTHSEVGHKLSCLHLRAKYYLQSKDIQ